jgi:hypothetical protein
MQLIGCQSIATNWLRQGGVRTERSMATSTRPGAAAPGRRVSGAEALHNARVFAVHRDVGIAGARDERPGAPAGDHGGERRRAKVTNPRALHVFVATSFGSFVRQERVGVRFPRPLRTCAVVTVTQLCGPRTGRIFMHRRTLGKHPDLPRIGSSFWRWGGSRVTAGRAIGGNLGQDAADAGDILHSTSRSGPTARLGLRRTWRTVQW